MLRLPIGATALSFFACTSVLAQPGPQRFVGAAAGISTLSADARSEITSGGVDVSLYTPENGPALNVLFGVHVHDYLTVQANYVGNRNDVALTSVRATESGSAFYEQPRATSQHAVVADLLVYFRERRSRVRPYALLRVAVGIDVALRQGWSARYSFSESVSGNPISAQLSPAAPRNLANFQNLFGVVRTF